MLVFQKIWRGLFEIRSFALLPTKFRYDGAKF